MPSHIENWELTEIVGQEFGGPKIINGWNLQGWNSTDRLSGVEFAGQLLVWPSYQYQPTEPTGMLVAAVAAALGRAKIFLPLTLKLKSLDRPACGLTQVEYRYAPADASLRSAAGASGHGRSVQTWGVDALCRTPIDMVNSCVHLHTL
jgi:hypothetical protein